MLEIANETKKLSRHFEIGQIEELLEDRSHQFRYLVYKSYKIIYCKNSEKNRIEIVDIFDADKIPLR